MQNLLLCNNSAVQKEFGIKRMPFIDTLLSPQSILIDFYSFITGDNYNTHHCILYNKVSQSSPTEISNHQQCLLYLSTTLILKNLILYFCCSYTSYYIELTINQPRFQASCTGSNGEKIAVKPQVDFQRCSHTPL